MARVRADELRVHDDFSPDDQLTITPCLGVLSENLDTTSQQFGVEGKKLALACVRGGLVQTNKRKE